jgi:hypothetical protein
VEFDALAQLEHDREIIDALTAHGKLREDLWLAIFISAMQQRIEHVTVYAAPGRLYDLRRIKGIEVVDLPEPQCADSSCSRLRLRDALYSFFRGPLR